MTQLGRTQDAIACYQKALLLNPENATAHFNLGTAWFQQQDLDRARHHLEQADRLDPYAVLTLNNLATVLVLQKKYAEAAGVLSRLTELRPESPTAYYNLACVYALQDKKPEAVAALKKAVDLGYDRWDRMKTDPDLKNIYDTDYFKGLMQPGSM
jgi:Flp pilus assembly protein TadD